MSLHPIQSFLDFRHPIIQMIFQQLQTKHCEQCQKQLPINEYFRINKQRMSVNNQDIYQDKDDQSTLSNRIAFFFNEKVAGKILLLSITIIFICLLTIFLASKFDKIDITIIVVFVGNDKLALQSFRSIQKNTYYPMIVGLSQEFVQFKRQISSFRAQTLQTTDKDYSLQFLNTIISRVSSKYFYLTTTEWIYRDDYFLNYSKNLMDEFQYISQVLPREINARSNKQVGFSFSPGLHRVEDYNKFLPFFSSVNTTTIFTKAEQEISKIYLEKGLKAISVYRFGLKRTQRVWLQNLFEEKNGNAITSAYPHPPYQSSKSRRKMSCIKQFVEQIENNIEDAQSIFEIQQIKQLKQLPFCLVVLAKDPGSQQEILQSIRSIKYSNKYVVKTKQNLNYYQYLQITSKTCSTKSVLLFVNQPLRQSALQILNKLHQTNLAWVTYHQDANSLEIYSIFYRIYQLLSNNDFTNTNLDYLRKGDRAVQTLGFFQLCIELNKKVPKSEIFQTQNESFFTVKKDDETPIQRQPYTKLLRLSQDMKINLPLFEGYLKNIANHHRNIKQEISIFKIMRAQQRQEQIYLPQNHSIFQLEEQQYQSKFNISSYTTVQKQVRFCLTVLSHNNIQNSRYKKAIDSIMLQKYQNYHIVFIDDMSDDANMKASIKYFQQVGFPKERLTFVQNLRRNFATYNIINSAFNFCHQDDIQMLMDGDDQLIGSYAFQVLNYAYQNNPDVWIAYSNYKNSQYQYGRSQKYYSELDYQKDGKRVFVSNIGPIRTWRVKLIYQIPPLHHKMRNGDWLDTVYDDAIQLALIQLSTIKRVKYINQVLYEYNVNYGDNDDSTHQKIMHRVRTFEYILSIAPLSPLNRLNGEKNREIAQQLSKDNRLRYQKVKD